MPPSTTVHLHRWAAGVTGLAERWTNTGGSQCGRPFRCVLGCRTGSRIKVTSNRRLTARCSGVPTGDCWLFARGLTRIRRSRFLTPAPERCIPFGKGVPGIDCTSSSGHPMREARHRNDIRGVRGPRVLGRRSTSRQSPAGRNNSITIGILLAANSVVRRQHRVAIAATGTWATTAPA